MVKKYKIILFACAIILVCNFVAKIYFVNQQSTRIIILQKVVAAARGGRYIKPIKPALAEKPLENDLQKILKKIPEEFLFTDYAAKIRLLIDKNKLSVENSLVFVPEKIKREDVLNYSTRIRVKGDYGKLKSLLSDFQNLPGLVLIDSVEMTRLKEYPDVIQMNLHLFVYFKRGKA